MVPLPAESAPDPTSLDADQASKRSAQLGFASDRSINLTQVFQLIDRVLPFEVCLYHQLLPLSLEPDRLVLGMVDPEDHSAIDYIRPMLSSLHCDLVPQQLSAETHSAVLSSYLSHSGKQAFDQVPTTSKSPASAEITEAARPQPDRLVDDPSNNPTLLVDSPIFLLEEEGLLPKSTSKQQHSPIPKGIPSSKATNRASQPLVNRPELGKLLEQPEPKQRSGASLTEEPQLALSIEAKYSSVALDELLYLTPPDLLQELLVRVLTAGIGRLYFEQQSHYGRVLWSQNGKVQEVLNQVPSSYIADLIDGLKNLTHTPSEPVKSLYQVEIERFYQSERLLLRLRVMPGTYGEEATLQILRGAALRFYQQQQLATLGRDALGIAQQLQNKIDELRHQTYRNPQMADEQLTLIPALDQVIQRIERQIAALKNLPNATAQSPERGRNGSNGSNSKGN